MLNSQIGVLSFKGVDNTAANNSAFTYMLDVMKYASGLSNFTTIKSIYLNAESNDDGANLGESGETNVTVSVGDGVDEVVIEKFTVGGNAAGATKVNKAITNGDVLFALSKKNHKLKLKIDTIAKDKTVSVKYFVNYL